MDVGNRDGDTDMASEPYHYHPDLGPKWGVPFSLTRAYLSKRKAYHGLSHRRGPRYARAQRDMLIEPYHPALITGVFGP